MNIKNTAIILIGYQNDYFSNNGILHAVIEESLDTNDTLKNTICLLEQLVQKNVMVISTPICFTSDYDELKNAVGILKVVKDAGAFKKDTYGAETIDELKVYGDSIIEIPGKRGLDAFSNTTLNDTLRENNIENVVIAGTITSVCIDTTGRSAQSHGYTVSILSDCTAGRTTYEQEFYRDTIFPIYANVIGYKDLLIELG